MIKLHLGCGRRNFGNDWVHIDGGNYDHLDFHDVTKLPYENNIIDLIYSSHMLEYLDREEVVIILKEWQRVLKKTGTLRIAVPDFEPVTKLYLKGYKLEKFLGPLFGKMRMGDKTIYHKTVYDFESIKSLLENCGFQNVKKYDWRKTDHAAFDDHSQAYIPHMDKEDGTLISLNIECTK